MSLIIDLHLTTYCLELLFVGFLQLCPSIVKHITIQFFFEIGGRKIGIDLVDCSIAIRTITVKGFEVENRHLLL